MISSNGLSPQKELDQTDIFIERILSAKKYSVVLGSAKTGGKPVYFLFMQPYHRFLEGL